MEVRWAELYISLNSHKSKTQYGGVAMFFTTDWVITSSRIKTIRWAHLRVIRSVNHNRNQCIHHRFLIVIIVAKPYQTHPPYVSRADDGEVEAAAKDDNLFSTVSHPDGALISSVSVLL